MSNLVMFFAESEKADTFLKNSLQNSVRSAVPTMDASSAESIASHLSYVKRFLKQPDSHFLNYLRTSSKNVIYDVEN